MIDVLGVFRAGQKLSKSTTWKNAQLRVSLLVTIISSGIGAAAFFGYRVELTADEITSIAVTIGIIGGLLNGGTTVATTTSIGLPVKADNQPGSPETGVADSATTNLERGIDSDPRPLA